MKDLNTQIGSTENGTIHNDVFGAVQEKQEMQVCSRCFRARCVLASS